MCGRECCYQFKTCKEWTGQEEYIHKYNIYLKAINYFYERGNSFLCVWNFHIKIIRPEVHYHRRVFHHNFHYISGVGRRERHLKYPRESFENYADYYMCMLQANKKFTSFNSEQLLLCEASFRTARAPSRINVPDSRRLSRFNSHFASSWLWGRLSWWLQCYARDVFSESSTITLKTFKFLMEISAYSKFDKT